jgi:hypothetical protein
MGQINFKNHKTARGVGCAKTASAAEVAAATTVAEPAARPGAGLDFTIRELATTGAGKARGLLRLYVHSRKVRAAAQALAQALAESREVWSWPGDRLPVGAEMSQQVEKLTRRLKLETEAHNRLEALFRTADGGRSVVAF